jgi:hypothetical protein
LLIIVGIMEFGRILIIYTSITNAVREGARYGVVVQNETEIRQVVNEKIILIPPGDVNLTVACDSGPGSAELPFSDANCFVGGRVIVRADYAIQALTPIIQPFMGAGIAISPDGIRTIASARTSSTGGWVPTVTPEGGGSTPDAEATGTAEAMATGTAAANMTATVVALSATPTNTPDPSATATPIILAPIIIDDPVLEGETSVSGTAEPNQAVTLRIIQTGVVRTVTVDGSGNFAFNDLAALVAGHTILVQGYGEQDLEIVEPLPTPTPSLTPTSTPEFTENVISISASCTDGSTLSLTVTGTGWPATASAVKDLRFMLFLEDGTELQLLEVPYAGGSTFTQLLLIDPMPEGVHVLQVFGVKSGSLVPGYESNQMEISRPCPANPTPTLTPTPTPITEADLIVSGLTLYETEIGTYEKISVTVGISNLGERDVSTLHWIDLFADPAGDVITDEISVDYVALNALGAGSTISFTMYVPNGFETTGPHTLVAMVDTWNQVEESDETNNISAALPFTITIANLKPTPTATPEITPGPRGSIQGMTYLSGVPQSNVAIYVYDAEERLWGSGRSDIYGNYSIDELPAGEYVVVGELRLADVQYIGQIGPVPVNSGQTTALVDIELIEIP